MEELTGVGAGGDDAHVGAGGELGELSCADRECLEALATFLGESGCNGVQGGAGICRGCINPRFDRIGIEGWEAEEEVR